VSFRTVSIGLFSLLTCVHSVITLSSPIRYHFPHASRLVYRSPALHLFCPHPHYVLFGLPHLSVFFMMLLFFIRYPLRIALLCLLRLFCNFSCDSSFTPLFASVPSFLFDTPRYSCFLFLILFPFFLLRSHSSHYNPSFPPGCPPSIASYVFLASLCTFADSPSLWTSYVFFLFPHVNCHVLFLCRLPPSVILAS